MQKKVIIIWAKNDEGDIFTRLADEYGAYPTLVVEMSSDRNLWFELKSVLEFRNWLKENKLEGGIIEREIELTDEDLTA